MLYICATPIGNLNDISLRALKVLNQAQIILCEDTRISQRLLNHHGIFNKRLVSLHEHNEQEMAHKVLAWLNEGLTLVQISDAGTPGISDPGARLCNLLYQHGITPQPIPGACAYISLLSVSGLVNSACLFHGFLANKATQRQKQLVQWQEVDYAVCIYESPHRINESLYDIIKALGPQRELVFGRELTKQFETIKKDTALNLSNWVNNDQNQQRGELVLIILPAPKSCDPLQELTNNQKNMVKLLATELATKKAVNLTHQLCGGNKDLLYQFLLKEKESAK